MHKLIFAFMFVMCSVQAQESMNEADSQALRLLVKNLASTTSTISSDFVQYKHLDFLDNDIETSGKLSFKAPDIVKWEYTNPFKYSVLFKNEKLYINDEGKKSDIDIGSNKLFKQLNKLIIGSVKGDMFDADEFDISYFKEAENSLVHFDAKDEKFSKYIKTFHITFNESGDVIQVKMIEPSGDYTKIIFSNKLLNQPIDESVFNN